MCVQVHSLFGAGNMLAAYLSVTTLATPLTGGATKLKFTELVCNLALKVKSRCI